MDNALRSLLYILCADERGKNVIECVNLFTDCTKTLKKAMHIRLNSKLG